MARPNSRQTLIEYCLRALGEDIFLDNKYFKWYANLVDFRRTEPPTGYSERHHAIPKSLGGGNEASNIVRFTAREHFIAHMLLIKCMKYPSHKTKMALAAHRLLHGNDKQYTLSSRSYETVKKEHAAAASKRSKEYWSKFSKAQRTVMRVGENNSRYGATLTEETRAKISIANSGNTHRLGKYHTSESKAKMSENRKGKGVGMFWCHDPTTLKQKLCYEVPDNWLKGRK